jgi:hypothetical protein
MLHITNGDSAAYSILATGVPGTVLSWRDVLHLGPIPAGLSRDALRDVRARFLADSGWASYDQVLAQFEERDRVLIDSDREDEVVLWFEHDLYDQLQLLQILDWFAEHPTASTRRSLICVDRFPGVEPFYGLGQLTPDQLATLFPRREPLTEEQLELGRRAWAAVRSPDPRAIEVVIAGDTGVLPFLRSALTRLLEEFPSAENGLSRTERQALELLRDGPRTPVTLFRESMAREEHPFFGDLPFWTELQRLSAGRHPMIETVDGSDFSAIQPDQQTEDFLVTRLQLTTTGRDVLAGNANAIDLNGIDRWVGGVHLHGLQSPWRWEVRTDGGQLLRQ